MEEDVSEEETASQNEERLHDEEQTKIVVSLVHVLALSLDLGGVPIFDCNEIRIQEFDDFRHYCICHELHVEEKDDHDEDVHQVLHGY